MSYYNLASGYGQAAEERNFVVKLLQRKVWLRCKVHLQEYPASSIFLIAIDYVTSPPGFSQGLLALTNELSCFVGGCPPELSPERV